MNKFLRKIYGKKYVGSIFIVGFFCAIASLGQLVLTTLTANMINEYKYGFSAISHYFMIIIISLLAYILFEAIAENLRLKYTNCILTSLRNNVSKSICNMEYSKVEMFKDGDVLSIVTNDMDDIRDWLNTVYQVGYIPLKVGLALAISFKINWKLMLIMFPIAPIIAIITTLISKKLYGLNKQSKDKRGQINTLLSNAIHFAIVVRAFCLKKNFAHQNDELLSQNANIKQKTANRTNFVHCFGCSLGHLSFMLIFLAGSFFVLQGELSLGNMVMLTLLANMIGEGLNIIQTIPTSYRNGCAAKDRLIPVIEENNQVSVKTKKIDNLSISNIIYQFNQVSFSYNQNENVLKDISFSIHEGEKIAIVGMSGCGKTTMLKLLCGLYKTSNGELSFCGEDMKKLTLATLAKKISVVPQELFLFEDTIYNNITVGCLNISKEQVIHICKKMQIHDIIMSLPDGYDTNFKNINKSFSRGQIQRLNLARAFLKNSPVMLLDEPTSALDITLQNHVMDLLLNNSTSKTIIMIIHRLSNPELFDKILVMENGIVIGFDNHNALMKNNCVYRKLLEQLLYKEGSEQA
ncbi:ABC transporter ATP-binding protein [Sedimentibacter sp. zth1]|uniref:ABC transporter ATP-binding protein n=1 Tax=Sedimentibacter sp. zth1 TaxID=2816908 RepID=UPI001A90DF1F|nr:ABC transporter ATP-binding protein [Sedimentibacter sp. zth1]QSX06095.1 ABC transporter ATP-binding protein [Sedimentibacter sp. zth1]